VTTSRAAARRVVHCIGTVFSFDVRAPGGSEARLDEAAALLRLIDETFSTYRDDSEISRLGPGERGDCSPDVRHVLAECERYRQLTDGYFSACADGSLNPSGYVKAWAIERASNLLCTAGSVSHSVNGGGDVQCIGDAGAGRAWRIGISDPRAAGRIASVVAGTDFAVATSGVEQRGAHILDPHTRRPPSGLLSLTIVGPRLTECDVYATAGFVMGRRAQEWVDSLSGYRAFAATEEGGTWSAGWPV
jgi:thiamine biosynthesis lipoprotein